MASKIQRSSLSSEKGPIENDELKDLAHQIENLEKSLKRQLEDLAIRMQSLEQASYRNAENIRGDIEDLQKDINEAFFDDEMPALEPPPIVATQKDENVEKKDAESNRKKLISALKVIAAVTVIVGPLCMLLKK